MAERGKKNLDKNPESVQDGNSPETDGLSIGALSRATGISIHSLRMWERRYGAPKSFRRPSGHRRYSYDEVHRVRAVARALAAGFRAGEVAGATIEEIDKLLNTLKSDGIDGIKGGGQSEVLELHETMDEWIEATEEYDERRLTNEFHDAWVKLGPLRFISDRAVPYIKRLGDGWQCGDLNISEEHFGSERLADFLSSIWRRLNERCMGSPFVLATLPKETHRLGLHMCAMVTVCAEHRVVFLGPQSPPEEIVRAVDRTGAGTVCLSISGSQHTRSTLRSVDYLLEHLPKGVDIICGGSGAPQGVDGITVHDSMSDFYEEIRARDKKAQDAQPMARPLPRNEAPSSRRETAARH